MEIYKHYLHSYNTLIQKQTLDAAGCVSEGALTLPACIYAGSFSKLVNEWDEDDEDQCEEVQNHIAWKKREKRGKVILLFSHSLNETGGDMKKEEEGERSKYSRN
jgi:hypothetical protein